MTRQPPAIDETSARLIIAALTKRVIDLERAAGLSVDRVALSFAELTGVPAYDIMIPEKPRDDGLRVLIRERPGDGWTLTNPPPWLAERPANPFPRPELEGR